VSDDTLAGIYRKPVGFVRKIRDKLKEIARGAGW
jgi:hypothetical protein